MTLDPQLRDLRRSLGRFRRRVWLRRMVRHGSLILSIVAAAELALAVIARVTPLDFHLPAAVGVVVVGVAAFVVDAIRIRPSLAEAALAVDSEDGLSDRVSTALALASKSASSREDAAVYAHLVELQRRDALNALVAADPRGLRIPLPRRQSATTAFCALMLIPAILLPNIQNDILAQRAAMRDAAATQAQRLEQTANRLQEGRTAEDPRSQLADELRKLAQQLRDHPEDLDTNLAKLGSLEDAIRSRLDPANEQRAAAISSLSRSLSRAATGSEGNPQGDPEKTKQDLDDLKNRVGQMTQAERDALAHQLTQMDNTARQAGSGAQAALADAVRGLRSGDAQAVGEALDRLGEELQRGQQQVDSNRDLAGAAGDLQPTRRDLALVGQQGQAQQGQDQQRQGQQGRG
jgi:hypothetical protein